MINKLSTASLVLIFASLLTGCSEPVKKESTVKAAPAAMSLHSGDEKYIIVDPAESVVEWKGSMLMGSNDHNGYAYISKGELMIEDGQLTGGAVEVDMNTIEDESHKSNNELIKHLKSDDFFDVERFPLSTIVITKVASINAEDKEITANLSIKGITHPVTFPAKLESKNGTIKANGKLTIDRTKWDVRYRSGKFFDNLADQTIADSIEFDIKIVAKPGC